jgi:hypothetical protein
MKLFAAILCVVFFTTAMVGAIAAGAPAAVTVAVVKKGPPNPPQGTIGVGGGPVFGPLR